MCFVYFRGAGYEVVSRRTRFTRQNAKQLVAARLVHLIYAKPTSALDTLITYWQTKQPALFSVSSNSFPKVLPYVGCLLTVTGWVTLKSARTGDLIWKAPRAWNVPTHFAHINNAHLLRLLLTSCQLFAVRIVLPHMQKS